MIMSKCPIVQRLAKSIHVETTTCSMTCGERFLCNHQKEVTHTSDEKEGIATFFCEAFEARRQLHDARMIKQFPCTISLFINDGYTNSDVIMDEQAIFSAGIIAPRHANFELNDGTVYCASSASTNWRSWSVDISMTHRLASAVPFIRAWN
jgi:hypothetical protein